MEKYDLIVIGSGSGGLVAALTANRRGLKVAMLEKNKIGGECTHSGCVPSKALINSAKAFKAMQEADKLGLPSVNVKAELDFAAVMEHVDDIVQGIYMHEQPDMFREQNIDVYIHESGASFLNEHEVQIGDDTLFGEHIIICTGSSPRMLETKGNIAPRILHNENFWNLREQPKSIAFLGGGVISIELGQALARFGTKVHILERNDRIIKVTDEEVGHFATELFRTEGLRIYTNSEVKLCEECDRGVQVTVKQPGGTKQLDVEYIFAAIGRTPNINGLDLEKAGVSYNPKGVETNEYLQTSTPHIYACGDVTTPAKFTHTASYQAEVCIENILGNPVKNDLSILPWTIFSEPEIAHVGLTEAQARAKHGDGIQVFKVDASIDRFITDRKTEGFLKVTLDKNDNILGADAIGAHAGEWIQFITLALKHNLSAQDFAATIFAYPTYSEIIKKVFTRFLRTKL